MSLNYIDDYLCYATGNEAPLAFHRWGAYVTLSAAVSRKVWMDFDDGFLFPNIYVMYVGGAGNGKSMAFDKVNTMLSRLEKVPRSANIETVQSMIDYMVGAPTGDKPRPSPVMYMTKWPDGIQREVYPMTILADEFINFISLDESKWINMLNEVYGCKDTYTYRTLSLGEKQIIGPYFVMLANLTTETANDMHKTKILNTGLARRTLFQFGERQWNNPHSRPLQTEAQKAAFIRCVNHLKFLRTVNGAFTWDPDTIPWWDAWYAENLAQVPKQPPTVQSWFASKNMQVLKLAMLTALAEQPPTLVLSRRHFDRPLAYLSDLEADLYRIFGGTGRNQLAGATVKILEYIRALDEPVSKKSLKLKFWNHMGDNDPARDFELCIQHLLESEQVIAKTVTIRGVTGDIIARDQATMSAFLDRVTALPPPAAVPPAECPAPSDPSTEPPAPRLSDETPAPQDAVPPVGGISAAPPPMLP